MSKEYQTLNEKIIQLEKENVELNNNFEKSNQRLDDWYTNLIAYSVIFITLLLSILSVQWINSRNVARKQAIKELKSLRGNINEAEEDLDKLLEKTTKYETALNLLK